mgnify:CR=1 FL=1
MAKIKVVQVITRLIKGGAQKVCLDIAEGLPKDRHEVFLLSGPETGLEGSLWDKARQITGVRIKVIPELVREISPVKDLTSLIRLYYFLYKTRPDIIHCHTSKAGFIGCLAGWLARVPVIIFSPHGHLFSPTAKIPSVSHSPLRMQIFYRLTRLAYALSTKVIAQNAADKDEQMKLRLAPANKYEIIHNAVEIASSEPKNTRAPDNRYPILATLGRLSPEKGQVFLLEALKSVTKEFPDALLLVIGDGALRQELESFAEKENLSNNVRFTGLCDEPAQLLKDIDIFILPSLYESFGIVLLEAMAQGKPVIASNVNGIPEVVVDNQTGILVPPANPQALSEAIIKLANDKELAREMGIAGYERVNKFFRKEQMVNNFDNLYSNLTSYPVIPVRWTPKSHTDSFGAEAGIHLNRGLIIEPAHKSDLPVIAAMHIEPSVTKVPEIIRKTSGLSAVPTAQAGAYEFYLDKVRMFHAIEPNGVLLARENNQITGFIIATKESNFCHKDTKTPRRFFVPLCLGGYPLNFLLRFTLKSLFLQYGIDKEMIKKLFMVPYANLVKQKTMPLNPTHQNLWCGGKIWAFIIMKETRRQGLGLKLIDAACTYASQQGANAVGITVAKDNLPALNLYQKVGFRICGECLESTGPSYYLARPAHNICPVKPKLNVMCGVKHANRSIYNAKTVEQYDQNPSIFEPTRQAEIKNIITFISAKTSGGTFLDIGCGTGNVLRIARQHFGLALGVDIAEKFLKEVKKLHPELDLIAADSNRLPFKNKAFDCISLYGTLHHLFDPAKTLGRITSLLKTGGYLYTDHDPNYFFGRFYHLYYRLRHHHQPGFGSRQEEMAEFHNTQTGGINPESLKAKLLHSGFQDVQVHYRHTSNPSLPMLERLGLALLKTSAHLAPLKSFYTHFYIIGRR